MINWNLISKSKPPVDKQDQFNKENGLSKSVLVHFRTGFMNKYTMFGQYHVESDRWIINKYTDPVIVIAWSELNEPVLDTWGAASQP